MYRPYPNKNQLLTSSPSGFWSITVESSVEKTQRSFEVQAYSYEAASLKARERLDSHEQLVRLDPS